MYANQFFIFFILLLSFILCLNAKESRTTEKRGLVQSFKDFFSKNKTRNANVKNNYFESELNDEKHKKKTARYFERLYEKIKEIKNTTKELFNKYIFSFKKKPVEEQKTGNFLTNKVIPSMERKTNNVKHFINDKAIPAIKSTFNKAEQKVKEEYYKAKNIFK